MAPVPVGGPQDPAGEAPGAQQPARRRRALPVPAQASHSPGLPALPGLPDPGAPVYPGLEHALPPIPAQPPTAGYPSAPDAEGAAAAPDQQPTGRRRRLGIPAGPDGQQGPPSQGGNGPIALEPPRPGDAGAGHGSADHGTAGTGAPSAALALAESAVLPATVPAQSPAPALPGGPNAPAAPQQVPVGTGLGELTPPRPSGFASAFPAAFPAPAPAAAPGGPGAPVRPAPALPGDAALEQRVAPRPIAELAPAQGAQGGTGHAGPGHAGPGHGVDASSQSDARLPRLSGEDDPALPAGAAEAAARVPEYPDYPTMVTPAADGRPRRLLVWPEPDPSTKQALQDRGYRPVIVRSREEVDAQIAAYPAALFVDPLTGPITRTALQSLRTAALNSRVPVLVTAGLGQATRDAAYGADPAVLLRALAPRDSENHAARVLLVEGDPDIAAALTSSLERRGMHVEHAVSENDAVSKASSVQPNLVVMDLLQIRRRRLGLLDWLRANDRLHRTPLVVYTSMDLDPAELPRLRTGETVLFLAERSTSADVQSRIVDLLGRIGALGEVETAG
ncbi:hypothetical protein GCM10009665_61840 [Kitasatospora nipponensis]|uniref:Response regulatory domain-containing protein n=1 Tax=Kitasatospora nipponensis TaxID=258049 RepID=A0ABN1WVD6_9ACTN